MRLCQQNNRCCRIIAMNESLAWDLHDKLIKLKLTVTHVQISFASSWLAGQDRNRPHCLPPALHGKGNVLFRILLVIVVE